MPDETRSFDPFDDDAEPRAEAPTRQFGPAAHQPDATRRMPLPEAGGRGGDPGGVWSGRAGVPPPSAVPTNAASGQEWEPAERPDGRPWWLPILLGILGLVLLAVLATGIWLIRRSTEDRGDTPVVPTSAPVVTPSAPPASTTAPTSAPPPTSAAVLAVPPLTGLSEADARARLDQAGLNYRLRFRASDQPPGTVVGTDPRVGSQVAPGTVVTLIVAEAPTGAPSAAPSTPVTGTAPTASPR